MNGSDRFPHLFSPLTIGTLELRNRIVVLPMGTRYSQNGEVHDKDVAFYRARAEGGVGLVITGGTVVSPFSSLRDGRAKEAFCRENIPGFARLASAVHEHGARIFGQLYHRGREAVPSSAGPMAAPSAIRSPTSPAIPHELTRGEIEGLVAAFTTSAANLLEAGYDGIELHAAHGYLLSQFLSPRANQRADEYGVDVDGRLRFLREVVDEIRRQLGDGFPLGVRLSADEEVEGGLDLDQSVDIARRIAATGSVDYLSVAIGVRGHYLKDMSNGNALTATHSRAIRDATDLPVITSQRITHPPLAEALLAEGAADLIGMARAHIADANWTRHARSGDLDRILPCVGSLEDCRSRADGVGCVHSPVAGREQTHAVLTSADVARRVVVVGAGPAGLEVSRIAALRGHQVTLLERADHLGGQIAMAATNPHRAELEGIISFRREAIDRLGVDVRLSTTATPEAIEDLAPDVVVIATGARAAQTSIPMIAFDARVLDLWEVHQPEADLGGASRVVVVDDGNGSWETFGTAERLAASGLHVTIISSSRTIGSGIPSESIDPLLRRLRRRSVDIKPLTAVSAIEEGVVRTYDPHRLAATHMLDEQTLEAGAVVLAGPKAPDDELYREVRERFPDVRAVGDCVSPGRITHAILGGYEIAREL